METLAIGRTQCMLERTKIIIDTDPGDDIDDAFALALAAKSPEIEVVGITTVFRNTKARARMTKRLMRFSEREDIPVRAGVNTPFIQKMENVLPPELLAKETVDKYGLYNLPQYDNSMDNEIISDEHAVDFIIRMAHEYAGQLVLVLIGPFTNAAMAVRKDPSIVECIKEVRLIGGWYQKDLTEWNVACDPEAAYMVFTAGWPIYAVGIDITLRCELNKEDVQEFHSLQGNTQNLITQMMDKWFEYYRFNSPVMHDPLVIGTLLEKDIVTFAPKYVRVGLTGAERGKTIVEPEKNTHNTLVQVSVDVKSEHFLHLLKERIFK